MKRLLHGAHRGAANLHNSWPTPALAVSLSGLLWRQSGHTHPGIPTTHAHTCTHTHTSTHTHTELCCMSIFPPTFSHSVVLWTPLLSIQHTNVRNDSAAEKSLSSVNGQTKSLSGELKIDVSLWFYYYCSIEHWCNWPRKAIWVKMEGFCFFFLTSKQQKVKRSNTKTMPRAAGTGILEIIFRNTTVEDNIYLWLAKCQTWGKLM